MNLEQLTIGIRPRPAWEAVDLGILMARRWWWPTTRAWLLLTMPLFIMLNFIPGNFLWLSYVLLWWLKPLFERPLLFILSQAVFNLTPDTQDTLKAFPALASRQITPSLTWRRLSPSRSMDLPVIQLEGLTGSRRSERLDILHREDSAPSTWLSITGFFAEIFIAGSLLALLYILIPEEVQISQIQFFNAEEALWPILFGCYYLALAAVAPFYIASGFSLYLNRRIKLEAWDIDIAFRRIVSRRSSGRTGATAALLIAVTMAGLSQTSTSRADTVTPLPVATEAYTPYARESAKTAIQNILAAEDFHQKEIVRYPTFNFGGEDEKKPAKDGKGFWEWLFGLFKSAEQMANVATGMELLLWAAIVCLIFFVTFRYRHWLAAYLPQRAPKQLERTKPIALFGLDLTRESLPDDISASALAFLHAGEQRRALALLYRASLSRLLERGLNIEDGHTEAECLEVAQVFARERAQAQPAVAYFSQLTQAWRRLAYGHISPAMDHAEQLCQHWNAIWDPAKSSQRRVGANSE